MGTKLPDHQGTSATILDPAVPTLKNHEEGTILDDGNALVWTVVRASERQGGQTEHHPIIKVLRGM